MKGLIITLGAAAIAMGASYVQAAPTPFTYGYEASTNLTPENSTPAWGRYWDGDYSVSGGILTVTTPGTHGGTDLNNLEFQQTGSWAPTGVGTTVEVKLKTNYSGSEGWAGGMVISTGSWSWGVYIGSGAIGVAAGGTGDLSIATDDAFHTYRFAGDETTGILSLYVDGSTTPAHTWNGTASAADYLSFGVPNASQAGGQIEWDYVRWTNAGAYAPVPEPASLTLLALGGLALRRRRRA
jgi:hypothetical protein